MPPHAPRDFYEEFRVILDVAGENEQYSGVHLRRIYTDPKITLFAKVELEDNLWKFEFVRLDINLLEPTPDTNFEYAFGMPVKGKATPVYFGFVRYPEHGDPQLIDHYFRPGRWIEYIAKLTEKLKNENAALMKLNKKPVDDFYLFKDL